jgi:hypothetical protein
MPLPANFRSQIQFLELRLVVDTTRLKRDFDFTPRWSTRRAFDDHVHAPGLRPVIDPAPDRPGEQDPPN